MARVRGWVTAGVAGGVCLAVANAPSQTRERPTSPAPSAGFRPVPVAEARLVCEGVGQANFDGLARTYRRRPAGADAWAFARGQALLVAEAGNLLLIRPPRAPDAQAAWAARAADLRDAGVRAARAAGAKDLPAARAGLADVANACNRCHDGFGVAARADPAGGD